MRAEELAEEFPIVELDTSAMSAARTLAARRLPGLIVVDDDGRPYTVLPGSQVLRLRTVMAPTIRPFLGADLGGNATAIGASANVVVLGVAARNGHPISFWTFTKYGLVVAATTIFVAWCAVFLRYYAFG